MENVDFSLAYDYIRQRILGGQLSPGTSLQPDVLAKKIGISRTPIREALRQLAADGLVTNRPRLGASVRSFSINEYSELAGLRMALEIFAAGLAAQLRTPADLNEMNSAHEGVKAELERLIGDPKFQPAPVGFQSEHLVREDIRFHMAITTAARNELIKKEIIRHQLINRIVVAGNRIENVQSAPQSRVDFIETARSTIREHQDILDAITRQDVAAARDAMEQSIQVYIDSIRQRIAEAETQKLESDLAGMA
jgi:DNA-binding GntR family transcriptional regulator